MFPAVMYCTVPELAAKATWADRGIYANGPDAMIVKIVQVSSVHLIRYDQGGQAD
jgi:hypothetical protein